MTYQEKKEEKRLKAEFKAKYAPKRQFSRYHDRTKAQRIAWWQGLTPEQQAAYIEKRQAQKSEHRAATNYESTCTVFPEINDSNRAEWRAKIKRLNPWMKFDSEAQSHLASIKQEIRSA